ncbi:MAG: glycosyltransferase family 4 protein [Flavicella sp.]
MKIGMILDYVYPPDPRVENEAIALVKAGHEVFLFCLNYENQPEYEKIHGFHVCRYMSNKIEYKLSALAYTVPFYTLLMARKIQDFAENHDVDCFHIHDIRIAEAVFKVNKKLKLPVILDLHDNLPEVMKMYPHLQKFPGKYIISPKKWKEKEAVFIEKASRIITVSQEFINEVVKRIPSTAKKIHLVPNTVRTSFYEGATMAQNILGKYKNAFVILYLGDTHLRRGLQTAIAAIPKLKEEISNLKLVIVGTNTTDTVLKKQVKDLGIEAFVDFEGWKDVSLFPSYIKSSAICISPLHRNIQHDVAYANKLFQYMSFAKPLLVSDAIAQKNLIQRIDAGLVHSERDVVDFIDKVILLKNNPVLCEKMGEKGKAFIENEFCWEKASQNLVHLYDNL